MPELPEVECVRIGLAAAVAGRTVAGVQVYHPRAVRRHVAGSADFTSRLAGRQVLAARRRGKYLWLPLDSGEVLLAHLGMSGQLRVAPAGDPDPVHLRAVLHFTGPDVQLRYVDQRMFGGLAVVAGPARGGPDAPPAISHIAPDPLESAFDPAAFALALTRRRTQLKRALLDQTLISGIGNIYADEALWRARLHWARPTAGLRPVEVQRLLAALGAVLGEAIAAGGTTFDGLYVDTDGRAGYFVRELAVYGRAGQPCPACRTPVRREPFMNRSSFRCPRCQPDRPRLRGSGGKGVTVT